MTIPDVLIFIGLTVVLVYLAWLDLYLRRMRAALKAHGRELTAAADAIHKLVEIERDREAAA